MVSPMNAQRVNPAIRQHFLLTARQLENSDVSFDGLVAADAMLRPLTTQPSKNWSWPNLTPPYRRRSIPPQGLRAATQVNAHDSFNHSISHCLVVSRLLLNSDVLFAGSVNVAVIN